MAEAGETPAGDAGASSGGGSKTPIILALLNTVAALAALGTFVYTRVMFERPPITEQAERARLQQAHAKPERKPEEGMISYEKITVNIRPEPGAPEPAPGTSEQIKGKVHYATVEMSLEVLDLNRREELDKVKAVLMDRILYVLGKKSFHELVTVQGRFVLRSEIMEIANGLLGKPLVKNVFFNTFIVQ